jgi:ankyrin repeat protein
MSELSFFKAAKQGDDSTLDQGINADNVNSKNGDKGYTALCYAAGFNKKTSVALLLQRDADVNEPGGELNQTPLMLAADRGHDDVLMLLLKAPGINVNATDAHGYNALMLAVSAGNIPAIQALMDKTNLNHVNTAGDTVFYLSDDALVNDVLVPYLPPGYPN